jgi:hypothetical protein
MLDTVNTIDKVLSKIEFNKDKGRFMVHNRTKTYRYDTINDHRLGKNPLSTTEDWSELSSLGEQEPKKLIKMRIVLKKSATDLESLEQLTAYFTQDLQVKVLSDDMYKYQYLTLCEGRVYIHNLSSGESCPLSMSGTQEGISKVFLGKPVRINPSEALVLLESGFPLYERVSEGEYRVLI